VTTLRATRLVAGRELLEAFRRKSYWAVFALLLAASTAVVVLPAVLGHDGPTHHDVAVVGDAPGLADDLRARGPAIDADIRVTTVPDVATARQRVEDGDVDVAVVPGDSPAVVARSGKDDALVGAVGQALATTTLRQRLHAAGLSDEQVGAALGVPAPRRVDVDVETSERRAASFVVSLVLYLLLLTLMMQVATGTAIEKANRISEVLLAVVRPVALLFGKVIGVGISGLVVLAAGIVPVAVKLVLGGDLPRGIGGALAGGAAWFALGLALYLTVAGALGALVERQEEVGSVMTPLTAVLVGTFIVAESLPESSLATVLAYVPLTSPLLVPTRIAMGVAGPVELVGSLAILVASIVVVARAGSAVYARGVVRNDRRLRLTDLLGRAPG
jgi:ABC-2 type transport system permease protein